MHYLNSLSLSLSTHTHTHTVVGRSSPAVTPQGPEQEGLSANPVSKVFLILTASHWRPRVSPRRLWVREEPSRRLWRSVAQSKSNTEHSLSKGKVKHGRAWSPKRMGVRLRAGLLRPPWDFSANKLCADSTTRSPSDEAIIRGPLCVYACKMITMTQWYSR